VFNLLALSCTPGLCISAKASCKEHRTTVFLAWLSFCSLALVLLGDVNLRGTCCEGKAIRGISGGCQGHPGDQEGQQYSGLSQKWRGKQEEGADCPPGVGPGPQERMRWLIPGRARGGRQLSQELPLTLLAGVLAHGQVNCSTRARSARGCPSKPCPLQVHRP